MKKVEVKEINGYDYTLDDGKKTHLKNIEFYGNYKPVVGDVIYLSESILNEVNLYAFDEVYDTSDKDLNDYIKVIHQDKEYYFQRKFG